MPLNEKTKIIEALEQEALNIYNIIGDLENNKISIDDIPGCYMDIVKESEVMDYPEKVIVCSACQATLKLYHLDFSAIKCTDCDNIITIEQIEKESEA